MMKRIIRMVLVLGIAFGAGYYAGQRSAEEGGQTFHTMSEDVMGRAAALGKGDLSLQKEFLQAKARFLDGKAEILNGKYEEAMAALKETLHHLQKTARMKGAETSRALLSGIMAKIERLQQALADGREIPPEDLREAQENLDSLL